MSKKIGLILTALSLVLTGCVSAPQGLEPKQFDALNLNNIQPQDYDCRCVKVRLGGKVISATALKNQTKVEVLNQTVAYFSAKPIIDSHSNGRFIAYLNGFVDPENLKDQYRLWTLVQEYYYDPDDMYDYGPFYPYGWGAPRFMWAEPRLRYNLY